MSSFTVFTATADEHDAVPSTIAPSLSLQLPLPHSSSQELLPHPSTTSTSDSSSPCPVPAVTAQQALFGRWLNPVWSVLSDRFQPLTSPRFLRLIFLCQLVLHASFLAAAVSLLISRAGIEQLETKDADPTAFRILLQMPVWLLVRSVVCLLVAARRLWLGYTWQPSTWEAAWVIVGIWLSTAVVAGASLMALAELNTNETLVWQVMELWVLVAALLILLGMHGCMYGTLFLFFPWPALTVNLPMVPLAQHWYDDVPTGGQPKLKQFEGLTQQQLQALPISVCTERADSCCAVCMDDVELGQLQRVLRCGHIYHQPCIDPWLLKRRVCPLCVQAVRPSTSRPLVDELVVELALLVETNRSQSTGQ